MWNISLIAARITVGLLGDKKIIEYFKGGVDMRTKIKPFRGKRCSRSVAKHVNGFLNSATAPDRLALRKEASEFENLMLKRRKASMSVGK